MKGSRLLVAAVMLAATVGLVAPPTAGVAATSAPLWVKHVQNFPGGISNGVRFSLDPTVMQAQARYTASVSATTSAATSATTLNNVQMNDDSYPPLPQNEESVAYSTDNPMVAVAGANDYVSGGTVVMRTSDGGRTWASTRVVPVFRPTSDICNGGDPAVAYSARDHAFYLSQLCFFRQLPQSEVQIYKSLDNGATWTPGRRAAIAATNFDPTTGTVDAHSFNDKEYLTVDNNPASPWYGRLYVTWTRFHILDDGSSDTCPIKLAYTDSVPSQDPSLAVWTHKNVVADSPGAGGLGVSANQFSVPVQPGPGRPDPQHAFPHAEHHRTGLQRGDRNPRVRLHELHPWAGERRYRREPFSRRRDDMVERDPDQPEQRQPGEEQPVLPVDRGGSERSIRGDMARPASGSEQPRHRNVRDGVGG